MDKALGWLELHKHTLEEALYTRKGKKRDFITTRVMVTQQKIAWLNELIERLKERHEK